MTVQFLTGNYAGTDETTKTITFPFEPKLFFMVANRTLDLEQSNYYFGIWFNGVNMVASGGSKGSTNIRKEGNSLTFSGSNYSAAWNYYANNYYYLCIG